MITRQKFGALCAIALAFGGVTLNAQGGYKGPGPELVTVETAKSLSDDAPVTLRGKIAQFLGDEKYLFADKSGNIVVEIDDKLWRDLSVDQSDTVEIIGEVDREFTRVKIDADVIKKLKTPLN